MGVECPLANLYAGVIDDLQERYNGVWFKAVDSNDHDSEAGLATFIRDHGLRVPFVKDTGHFLADRLGAKRSPEAFLLENGQIKYRGRIDDRYMPGRRGKSEPETRYLENAIIEVIAGQPVTLTETEPVGCFIEREPVGECGPSPQTTYADVAPILFHKCAECHRPGEVAPFSMVSYADTKPWADTIREVVEEGRMPPWQVESGHFVDDLSLTDDEKQLVLNWVKCGSPEGGVVQSPEFADAGDWKIGKPDLVLTMSAPFKVPATGNIEYQEFVLDPHSSSDLWIQAVEIRPGNRAIVHHVNTLFRPKGVKKGTYMSPDGDVDLASFVPGNSVTAFGDGIAKIVPAGWEIVLSIHYVTVGTPQEDQTSIGFKLLDADKVVNVAATRKSNNYSFSIPPNSVRTISSEEVLERDYLLAAITPHMHLRGTHATFEVQYPDGGVETLLKAKYDFNWQHRYVLAEPKPLPAGTKLIFTGVFDNTADNPNNPDPNATVYRGERTEDEMLHGLWDVYRPLEAQSRSAYYSRIAICISGLFGIVMLGRSCWVARGRNAKR
jgi:hypothetical protein